MVILPLNLAGVCHPSIYVPFPAPIPSPHLSANFLAKPVRDCHLGIQNTEKPCRKRVYRLLALGQSAAAAVDDAE